MFKDASDDSKEIRKEIRDLPDEIVDSDGADQLPEEIGLGDDPEDSSITDIPNDSKESNIENSGILNQIEKSIGTAEGIKELIARHPEKAKLWESRLAALETLNNPEVTPAKIRSTQIKLSILKGQLLETAAKDALIDAGFDVEPQQRIMEGENGGTRPDIIAKNTTDKPIKVFGQVIQPGEILSIECKCGRTAYMTTQLQEHIPNQLSGQIGSKVLLTTSDIKNTPSGLAQRVCDTYGAKLVTANISVSHVDAAIKEATNS